MLTITGRRYLNYRSRRAKSGSLAETVWRGETAPLPLSLMGHRDYFQHIGQPVALDADPSSARSVMLLASPIR